MACTPTIRHDFQWNGDIHSKEVPIRSVLQCQKNYNVLLHSFLNVILIILARYVRHVGTSDLETSPWLMDTGGRN